MRKKLNIRADEDLVRKAKSLRINISRLTEKALIDCIKPIKMGVHGSTAHYNSSRSAYRRKMAQIQGMHSDNELGWRVGSNPPSVLGDIHLIGIPAPLAEVTGAYYPFHGVGWLFTLTASLLNAGASSSLTSRGIFLRLNPTSRSTLRSATLPPRGWSFLRSPRGDP